MTREVRLSELDLSKAREYIPSQDPDVSLRFILPIPNWMDGENPVFADDQIKQGKKGWRYNFYNYKDNAEQGVKIDGSAAIIFMGLTRESAARLSTLVNEYDKEGQDFSPSDITNILSRSHEEIGIGDRFNKDLESIGTFFHPYDAKGNLGSFLPNPNPSSALYIEGTGQYLDGPTITPQVFENGAFINFPGKRLADLFKDRAEGKEIKGRLVQSDVFMKDRTTPEGLPINLALVPPQ